ncbi:MAG TPA: 2'-5' RNA ligase family protein [Caulobacteraceae bacterium]|jgi:2'-5' RNA ligase|nr:2'-5' RNA ligase family protein [Caulobacteraceae bacterium]
MPKCPFGDRPPGRPRPTDGFFFGIFPNLLDRLRTGREAWRHHDWLGLTAWPLPDHRLHATLCPLGGGHGRPPGLVECATYVADQVHGAPFEMVFDRIGSFRRTEGAGPVVALPGAGKDTFLALQQALRDRFSALGVKLRPYTPHVTLLYDHQRIEHQAIEPFRWTVREFVLVHSLIGRTRHIILGRWPLTG